MKSEYKKPKDLEEEEDWIDNQDVYSERARLEMVEDDEISSEEDGFMEGYDAAEG